MKNPEACGIIVDVHKTNAYDSKHVQHASDSYSHVYYILVNDSMVEGPYFHDELSRVN